MSRHDQHLLLLLLLFSLPLSSPAAAAGELPLPSPWLPPPPPPPAEISIHSQAADCPTHCGDLAIPFPFGTREGCYLNQDFLITCNSSGTPLLGHSTVQVLNISVDGELRIAAPVARDCYNKTGERVSNTASGIWNLNFPISNTKNKFTAVGCDTYALVQGFVDQKYATGCISYCSKRRDVVNGSCAGVGCCQALIPKGARGFVATLNSYDSHESVWRFNPCSYAFLVEESLFRFSTADLPDLRGVTSFPVVLDWGVGNETCKEAVEGYFGKDVCMENSECYEHDVGSGTGYRCRCSGGYRGNPYLAGGCQDINECEDPNLNQCTNYCQNTKGSYICSCPKGHNGDGRKDGSGCTPKRGSTIQPIVGVSASVSFAFLFIYLTFMGVHKRKLMKHKREFFKQNGGLLLEQLLFKTKPSSTTTKTTSFNNNTARIFTEHELNLATNNFNKSMVVGRGGYGVVYKGTFPSSSSSSAAATTVAIKKSMAIDRTQIEQFVNEVIVLSQIHHPNAVKLLGCCLETQVPLLVYEFITNGTLFQHVHEEDFKGSLPWDTRLRIAVETAAALADMHSMQIIHRDVKSANILLDDSFTAKVADFGVSRLVPFDQDQISTLVQGTLGYMDPEYFQSGILTDKSDVYSFGVLLAELLTGKKAISSECKEKSLALHFLCSLKEEYLLEILEERVKEEGDVKQLSRVAEVARSCLKLEGEQRPTMKYVVQELQELSKASSTSKLTSEHSSVGAGGDQSPAVSTIGHHAFEELKAR